MKNCRKVACFLIVAFVLDISLFSQEGSTIYMYTDAAEQTAEFEELDGILVVEVESVNQGAGWRGETLVSGFTGTSYLRWAGNDNFNTPGNGLTDYKIRINNPGTYHFRWHNKIMHGSEPTESNDSWLRIPDAADFYAKNGSSIKYPNGGMFVQSSTVTNGSSSNGWMKVYSSGTTSWTWSCRTSDNDPHEIYAVFDTAGVYTVQVSGRSKNHAIDRFVLFKDSVYTVTEATDKSLEEMMCEGLPETRYTLAINYGTGSGSFAAGDTIEIIADRAPSNKIFDKWVGDTLSITDVYKTSSSMIIPESDAVITATYIDDPVLNISAAEPIRLKVYPNPAIDGFYIETPVLSKSIVSIIDASGREVYSTDLISRSSFIETQALIPGIYIVKLLSERHNNSELIIIR